MEFEIIPSINESMSITEIATTATPRSWRNLFCQHKDEFDNIDKILNKTNKKFFPLKKHIFRAFELTSLEEVRVVIVGQDPYHQLKNNGYPRAQGLSFSVSKDDEIPSSLQNIYKEIKNNYPDYVIPKHGDLTKWAQQGILLLNTSLTVNPNEPGKQGLLWYGVLTRIIDAIGEVRPKCIYVLWGNHAKELMEFIPKTSIILTAAHPSGFSANRGFFGCGHFSQINKILSGMGEEEIDWTL